jgi:cleavage and polyadenylation specificity factor subunit 3
VPSKLPISTLRFALEALFEGLHTISTLMPEEEEDEENAEDGNAETTEPAKKKPRATKKAKKEIAEVEASSGENKFDVTKAEGLSINAGMVTIRKRYADEVTGVEHVVIEWNSDPLTDMIVDATLSAILQLENEPEGLKEAEEGLRDAIKDKDTIEAEKWRLKVVGAMLSAQFGHAKVNEKKSTLSLNIDGTDVTVEYRTRTVLCDNEALKQRLDVTIGRIDEAIGDAAYSNAVRSLSASSTKF